MVARRKWLNMSFIRSTKLIRVNSMAIPSCLYENFTIENTSSDFLFDYDGEHLQ